MSRYLLLLCLWPAIALTASSSTDAAFDAAVKACGQEGFAEGSLAKHNCVEKRLASAALTIRTEDAKPDDVDEARCGGAETKSECADNLKYAGESCALVGKGLTTKDFVPCVNARLREMKAAKDAVDYAYNVACSGEKRGTLAFRQCVDYELRRWDPPPPPASPPTLLPRPPIMLDCSPNIGGGMNCIGLP